MTTELPRNENTAAAVAELTNTALNLRGKMSEADQRSTLKTLITVLLTYAAARFNLLDPDVQSQLIDQYLGEMSFILSIPGVQAAYALWRKDRG